MTLIQVRDLRKTYKNGTMDVPVLLGINLTINAGEFVAIMGPSGSGKSTFMNILGCLDRPTSGEYILDNEEVARLSDNRLAEVRNQKFGFVFQSFNLLARTTAQRNVELPMLYAGKGGREARAKWALNRVRSWGPDAPQAQRAFRRSAAARRHRPRYCERSGRNYGGRTDRRSGHAHQL